MAIGKWYIDAEVNMSSVRKETSKLKKELKKSGDYLENEIGKKGKKSVNALSISFKKLGGIIAGVFATIGISKFIGGVMKLGSELEQAQISFTTLLGSTEKATEHLQKIDQFASQTPFNKLGIIKANQQLLGFGFNAEQSLGIMQVLGDSISAVGRGQEDLNGVVLALGQIQAKGKLSTEEVLQMAERGLPIFEVLKTELGLTKEELGNLGNAGIDSATAINAILTGLNKKYAGSMEKQAKTLAGMWSNLVDNVEIAMGKMGLNIGNSLKGIVGSINEFLDGNMGQIIDFGSDVLTFMIDMGKSLGVAITSIFQNITDLFGVFVLEENKTAGDSMKIWKRVFLFISIAFQGVAMLLNTFVGTFAGVIKSLASGVGSYVEGIGLYFQDFWGNLANSIIKKANWIIKGINKILSAVGIKEISTLKLVDTKLERSGGLWKKVGNSMKDSWNKSFDAMGAKNKKILDNMVNSLENYETETISTGKTTTDVFKQNADFLKKIDGAYTRNGKSAKKSGATQKKSIDEVNDKLKELKGEYKRIEDKIKKLDKVSEDYAKNSKKYNDEILENTRKLNKELEIRKKNLAEEIANIEKDKDQKLADRVIELENELAEKKEAYKNEKDSIEKYNLQKEINRLQAELNNANQNVNKDTLKETRRYNGLSETDKILEEEKFKKQQAQKEYEEEKKRIDSLLKINNAFYNLKKLDKQELDEFMKTETYKTWSEEEQELFLKLAREKIALTEQRDYKLQLERELNSEVLNLNALSTEAQLNNNEKIKKSYDEIIAKINTAIAKQAKLNAMKSSGGYKDGGYTGYSSGGYTGSGNENKVAGVVHAGEWVAPAWMLDSLGPVFDKLEAMRSSGNLTKTINKTQNNNIVVNSQFEAENFLDYANWKL